MNIVGSVKGKTTMPELSERFIVSENLFELAGSIQQKKAALIAAPSGYGKTAFAIYTMTNQPEKTERICWYRLDAGDAELSVFYANLVEAFFPEEDPVWAAVRTSLSDYTEPASQYNLINAVICREFWKAYGSLQNKRVYIAFDNYHTVAESPEIAETVKYLIDNLPKCMSVFITSREQPVLLRNRFLLDPGCIVVSGKELCFSENDVAKLAEKMIAGYLSGESIKSIYKKAKGWKAGTILLLQYLVTNGITEADMLLSMPFGDTTIFEYMVSEVLKNIKPELMHCLIEIAILGEFTEDEAREIFDNARIGDMLRECERIGLFIERILSDTIIFSFHNLFRETLLLLQKSYLTENEISQMHLKAAEYYQRQKMYKKATQHFIASGDYGGAVGLIVSRSLDFDILEAAAELRELLSMIPDEIVEEHAHLLYIKCGVYMQDAGKSSVLMLQKALVKFEAASNLAMQLNSLLALANLAMWATFSDKAAQYAMRSLKVLRKLEESPELNSMRCLSLFMAAVCLERFDRAKKLAECLHVSVMPDGWRWQFLMLMCDLHSATGDFETAQDYGRAALEENLSRKVISYKGTTLALLTRNSSFLDDAKTAKTVSEELSSYGQKFGFHYFRGVAERSEAYFRYASNDVQGASNGMHMAVRYFELQENPALTLLAKLCILLWQPALNDKEKRFAEASRIHDIYEKLQPGFCLKDACKSLFGAIARECGYLEAAETALLEAVSGSEAKGGKHVLCGALFHMARLYLIRHNFADAEVVIARAMALAADKRYVIFWDLHLGTMLCVLLYCVKKWLFAQYAMELLDRYFGDGTAAAAVRELRNVRIDSIDEAADRFLASLASPKRKATINIQLMGNFNLTCDGAVIPPDVWKTKKVKGILQYLAYRQGTLVLREQLMELFWPSANKDKAAESLNTAIYELRKVLKKSGVVTEGKSAVIKQQSGGLMLSSGSNLLVDTTELRQLWSIHKKLKKSGDPEAADKDLLLKIVALHTGTFLADDLYIEWALSVREQMDAIYLEAVKDLYPLMLDAKEYDELEPLLQKALDIDPYNEELGLDILTVYKLSGKRTQAIMFYQEFEKRLISELGVKPYDKIQVCIQGIKNETR